MNISGVLILIKPEFQHSIADALTQLPGVELHAVTEQGKMVVTLEMHSLSNAVDCLTQIQMLEGVLSVAMTYNQIVDESNNKTKNWVTTQAIKT